MATHTRFMCAQGLLAILCLAAGAAADYVHIEGGGMEYSLSAGHIPGVLSGDDHVFAMSDLELIAATLNGDGVDTVGHLSFLVASTDAGFSMIGLFDGVGQAGSTGSPDSALGIATVTSSGSDWFAGGDQSSQIQWQDMGNGTQLVAALLGWEHGQTSAGVAWGDLMESSTGMVNLYEEEMTLIGGEPVQFLSYEDGAWSVIGQAAFTALGQYAFSYQYIPAPGTLALLLVAGVATHRRRRC